MCFPLAILEPTDLAAFFPTVTQTGSTLEAFCAIAQSYCEGHYGANRPLEKTTFTEVSPVRAPEQEAIARLSMHPIDPNSLIVQARVLVEDGFSRIFTGEWQTLDSASYEFEVTTGELRLHLIASEVKVNYTAGYDFRSPTQPDVQKIKAIAGAILTHMGNHGFGVFTSTLDNPTGTAVLSNSFAPLDGYMKTMLHPLKRYVPYASGGVCAWQAVDIAVGVGD
jgi:hypothetical protein